MPFVAPPPRRIRRAGLHTKLAALLAAGAALAVPSSALGADHVPDLGLLDDIAAVAETAATAESCQDPETAPHLAAFGDRRDYFVAPGGTFEDGAAGWQLRGGAQIAPGSSALDVFAGGVSSLQLTSGSSATSPAFCVDERYPTFRLTLGQLAEKSDGRLTIQVLYPGAGNAVHTAASGLRQKFTGWQLTGDLDLQPSLGLKVGGWRKVALRFSLARGEKGDTRIDDILVDPRMR